MGVKKGDTLYKIRFSQKRKKLTYIEFTVTKVTSTSVHLTYGDKGNGLEEKLSDLFKVNKIYNSFWPSSIYHTSRKEGAKLLLKDLKGVIQITKNRLKELETASEVIEWAIPKVKE